MGFVSDVRTGAYDILAALADDHPDKLQEVHYTRPAAFSLDQSTAYVGDFRADLHATVQLRQWDPTTQVDLVLVFGGPDNVEKQERMDTLTQLLLDAWPVDGHFVENAVGEPVRIRTADLQVKEVSFPAVVVTIGRISYLEAR